MNDSSQTTEAGEGLTASELVEAIRLGDSQAEADFCRRYQPGLLLMLRSYTRDPARAEDFTQETLMTVLNKLREGGIDKPESLASYIQQTGKYLYIGWRRRLGNQAELRDQVDDVPLEQPGPDEQVSRARNVEMVRELIREMTVPRDREILYRYYVRDQEKSVICSDLGLGANHFDRVINRARNRFRALLEGRQGS